MPGPESKLPVLQMSDHEQLKKQIILYTHAFQWCNLFLPSQQISLQSALGLHSFFCRIQSVDWKTSSKPHKYFYRPKEIRMHSLIPPECSYWQVLVVLTKQETKTASDQISFLPRSSSYAFKNTLNYITWDNLPSTGTQGRKTTFI